MKHSPTTQPQADPALKDQSSTAIVLYQPQPFSEKYRFSSLPFELISHIFQQMPLFENRWLRTVSKTFFTAWEHAAQWQPFKLTPAIQPLSLDDGFKSLQKKQEKEIAYLTKHKANILYNNNHNPKLKKAFAKLVDLKGNQSLLTYHAKEETINNINELIIRNSIRKAKCALDCSDSCLTRIPKSVLKDKELSIFWRQLIKLNISNNRISVLHDAIGQLTALEEFDANNNQLCALPNTIGQLSALTLLNANDNQIAFLPDTIGQCIALKGLFLHSNKLAALPNAIIQCAALEVLDVMQNYLRNLPIGLKEEILYDFSEKTNKNACLAAPKETPSEVNQSVSVSEERPAKRQRLN
ncbi:MAG: hypothetical protein JSS07_00670 [Proteobacteria bacterium]|nr:hypothetical protein [Pseudomonadota bacterium]